MTEFPAGVHALASSSAEESAAALITVDLLIVTRRQHETYDYVVQDIIRNRCGSSVPVSVLVHDIDYMNGQLRI